jgi:DNA gyrase subunit A
VAATSSVAGEEVLLVTSGGYGKRTKMSDFRAQTRGGIGVKAFKLTRVRGTLVGASAVFAGDQAFLISSGGIAIRTPVDKVSRQGRDSTGVKVINVGDGSLAAFTVIANGDEEEE